MFTDQDSCTHCCVDNTLVCGPDKSAYEKFWRKADISIKFLFGHWCPYIATFPATVVSEHFTELPEHPPQTEVVDKWNHGSDVLFMQSHPVRTTLFVIESSGNTIRYVPGQYRRYYIDVRGSFSEYLSRIPSKGRLELRRKRKRFEESAGMSPCYREYYLARDMNEFYYLSREVSERSFQGKLGVGIPHTEKFRSDLLKLAEEGRVRGFLLLHQGRPVAYEYCRIHGPYIIGELCGYDPQMAKLSPGSVLMFCILEQLFEQQTMKLWDFGTGEANYKAFYSTGYTRCADIYYFRRNIKNSCVIAANCAVRASWSCISSMLEAARLRSRLKKMLRAHQNAG